MLRWQRRWRTALEERRDNQEEGEADAGARSLGGRGRLTRMLALSGDRGLGEVPKLQPLLGQAGGSAKLQNSRLLISPRQWP